jgi:hypothetical protein
MLNACWLSKSADDPQLEGADDAVSESMFAGIDSKFALFLVATVSKPSGRDSVLDA